MRGTRVPWECIAVLFLISNFTNKRSLRLAGSVPVWLIGCKVRDGRAAMTRATEVTRRTGA